MSVYDPGAGFEITPGRKFNARSHPGVDWWARVGKPIPAAAAGTVVGLGFEAQYGNIVIIKHTSEPPYRYTLYAHMEATVPVSLGSVVPRGLTIGYVDSTGSGGGEEPHLHFELVSLSDFTWESEWGRYIGEAEATWGTDTRRPLMLSEGQGRIDPLVDASWDGIDVYFPPPRYSFPDRAR